MPDAAGAEPLAPGSPAQREELLKYAVSKKSYILNTRRRFEYIKAYTIRKKIAEKEENPVMKMLKPLLASFTGKKEKR